MELIAADGRADFTFGQSGNVVLKRQAEELMRHAHGCLALHQSLSAQGLGSAVAQPGTISLTLFKIATRVKQY